MPDFTAGAPLPIRGAPPTLLADHPSSNVVIELERISHDKMRIRLIADGALLVVVDNVPQPIFTLLDKGGLLIRRILPPGALA